MLSVAAGILTAIANRLAGGMSSRVPLPTQPQEVIYRPQHLLLYWDRQQRLRSEAL